MPILFSAVACERKIISHFACCDGNFMEIAELVVSKLPAGNNKMTYSHGIYLLHYIAIDKYVYFCITDKITPWLAFTTPMGENVLVMCVFLIRHHADKYMCITIKKMAMYLTLKRIPEGFHWTRLCQRSRTFLFLNEIQRTFVANEAVNKNINTTLAAEMYRYSEDYSTITIRRGELDELNKIGVGCSEDLLGEKILYVKNPHNISYSTMSYVGCTPVQVSVSNIPRWYIVIIGIAILIIALAVYTYGPISCAVVTIIGIFSLLHARTAHKSKQ